MYNESYLTDERMYAYLEQYKYVKSQNLIIEIGKGAGVFECLVKKIAKYISFDYDKSLNPDYVVDISNKWSLDDKHVTELCNADIIFCCQVLEHIPFDKVDIALENLAKLKSNIICISVPNNTKAFRFSLKLPFIEIKKAFSIPLTGYEVNINTNEEHHWEICSTKIKNQFNKKLQNLQEYDLINEYRLFERTYQHFFILKKKSNSIQ